MGCDAAENYMLLEIHNWCKWLDCNMGEPRIVIFLPFHYRCMIEQPDSTQHSGSKNSEMEMFMWK